MRWPTWFRPPAPAEPDFLLRFGADALTWEDLLSGGCVAIGATGSGKTSTFAFLAEALLASQEPTSGEACSMVINCAKRGEAEHFLEICRRAGCLEDVVHLRPGCPHTLDVLQAELGREGGTPQSATQLLCLLNEVALRSGPQGQGEDSFWANLFHETLLNAIELVSLAGGGSIPVAAQIILSAPTSPEQAVAEEWARRSVCGQKLTEAARRADTPAAERRLQRVLDFFIGQWTSLGDRARGAALAQVSGVLAKFMAEPFHELLCSGATTLPPESVFTAPRRQILLLDFPVLVYGDPGRFAQILWTMLIEAAVLRRDVRRHPRPVVIWRDEAHLLCHPEWSAKVLSVGRSQRLVSVSLFQSLPGLTAAFGSGAKAELEAKSFITNHPVKFAYANGCKDTNEHLADLIGKRRELYFGGGMAPAAEDPLDDLLGVGGPANVHWNEQLDHAFPPAEFLRLRCGGQRHRRQVDAVWFQQGRRFASGAHSRVITFEQEERP